MFEFLDELDKGRLTVFKKVVAYHFSWQSADNAKNDIKNVVLKWVEKLAREEAKEKKPEVAHNAD